MVSGNRDTAQKNESNMPPYLAGCDMIRKEMAILHRSAQNQAKFPKILYTPLWDRQIWPFEYHPGLEIGGFSGGRPLACAPQYPFAKGAMPNWLLAICPP
jgi:hypothetical protein